MARKRDLSSAERAPRSPFSYRAGVMPARWEVFLEREWIGDLWFQEIVESGRYKHWSYRVAWGVKWLPGHPPGAAMSQLTRENAARALHYAWAHRPGATTAQYEAWAALQAPAAPGADAGGAGDAAAAQGGGERPPQAA